MSFLSQGTDRRHVPVYRC